MTRKAGTTLQMYYFDSIFQWISDDDIKKNHQTSIVVVVFLVSSYMRVVLIIPL